MLAIVEWGAWSLVRPGRRSPSAGPPPSGVQPVTITADDGTRLRGEIREPARPTGLAVLLLHGFAEDRTALRDRAAFLADLGAFVLATDVRGRGESDGAWTTFGDHEAPDLRHWLDFAAQQAPAHHVVVWGRSMGAAIALRAAAQGASVTGLILEAPYADLRSSLTAWLRRARLPGVLAGLILRRAGRLCGCPVGRPRPLDDARVITIPALIIYGAEDTIAPPSGVLRLASAFPRKPQLRQVPQARHVDVFEIGGDSLREDIAAWLRRATSNDQ